MIDTISSQFDHYFCSFKTDPCQPVAGVHLVYFYMAAKVNIISRAGLGYRFGLSVMQHYLKHYTTEELKNILYAYALPCGP